MTFPPILDRISQPTPEEVRDARKKAGLSQTEAAALVSRAEKAGYRTWLGWELPSDKDNSREIPLATWELFLLLVGQHPTLSIGTKKKPKA